MPRIELETGKALNIAPPGHEKYFDPLRDYFNYSKGWSRPDDPTLQRDTQTPDHVHFQDKSAVRAGLKTKAVKDIREIVGSYIEQRVEHGFIRDRKDVLDAVSELGTVTRTSDQFISLKIDGADKAIRLKGAFYESEFSIESYFENRTREADDVSTPSGHRIISAEHKQLALENSERVQDFQQDVQNTTQTATSHLAQTRQNLGLIETESLNLLNTLKEQVQQSQVLQQQAQQLIISTQENSTQQNEQIKHIKYMLIAVISLLTFCF